MKGCYGYVDTKNGDVVYIGKDSEIEKHSRYYDHRAPCNYHLQRINQVIQNNPERYKYEVICQSDYYSPTYLNIMEKGLIKTFNPKFNFSNGGDGGSYGKKNGMYGRKHDSKTKKKMRVNHADFTGENHPKYRHDVPNGKILLQEYLEGATQRELGIKYNIGQTAISRRIRKVMEEITL